MRKGKGKQGQEARAASSGLGLGARGPDLPSRGVRFSFEPGDWDWPSTLGLPCAHSGPSPQFGHLRAESSAQARTREPQGGERGKTKKGRVAKETPARAQAHRDPRPAGARERGGWRDRSALCRWGRRGGGATAHVHCGPRDASAACAAGRSCPPAG